MYYSNSSERKKKYLNNSNHCFNIFSDPRSLYLDLTRIIYYLFGLKESIDFIEK